MKTSTNTISLFSEVGLLIKSRMQQALSLPFSQCQALWFVAEQGQPTMLEVARHFKITAPSATFLVDELVRGSYLARRANAKDRRKVELALTRKGAQAVKTVTQKRTKILEGMFRALSEADRQDLNRILTKIIAYN
jgi:DNA-binding MarR family transcriptional regulator